MTTGRILAVGAIAGTAALIWYNYQKGKGKTFFGGTMVPSVPVVSAGAATVATSGVDGFDNTVTSKVATKGQIPNSAERRYPPNTYIGSIGKYTDYQGKVLW